jgi:surface protein
MATAFAIYSTTDNSLDFYNRDTVPSVGSIFEGKTVTKVYTNISAATPAWESDKNVKKIVSSTIVDVVSPTKCARWYNGAALLTTLNLTNLDTSNVTDMNYMFGGCTSLKTIDISNFNTSKVTNMRCMFYNCSNLEEIDVSNFNVSAVTNFEYVFYSCVQANIIGIEKWNTSSGTTMKSLFYKCASTPHFDLSGWNTSKVTDMSWMFNRGAGTIDFTGWDTSKVTDFTGIFASSYFTYLDLSSFDVSAVTTFNSMFFDSISLKTILVSHNWNETFKDGADTDWMFENCYALMGDIAYSDMNDAAEPDNFEHMTGLYATTDGGYLTMKYEESGDDDTYNKTYMVLGETLYELANSIRYMLGTPQKITLKNFSKVLQKQVNAIHSATLTFKDTIHNISDDVGYVGTVYFVNTNVTLQTAYMNRFYIIPTIMKGSIIALTNVINLTDDAEIITSGEITRLGDSLTFIINGNASITLQKKT